MEVAISSMTRVEGRSCYLVLGYKDGRVQIFEERGKGTGKLDSVGWIDECHPNSDVRPVTGSFPKFQDIHPPNANGMFSTWRRIHPRLT